MYAGLNPFLIRARFQSSWNWSDSILSHCLNPFLIRARFQSSGICEIKLAERVS